VNVFEDSVNLKLRLFIASLSRVPDEFQILLCEVLLVNEELNEFKASLDKLHVAVFLPEYDLNHILLS
jgi:hypothetical protein